MLKNLQFLKIPLLILFLQLLHSSSSAQSLAINTSGAAAHASALFDVSSTNKGMLIPRVSLTDINDVTTIATPATSLLVYNTNAAISGGSGLGYYYFDGGQWVKLIDTPANGWNITGNAGTVDVTNFIGTTDAVALNFKVNNQNAGRIDQNGSTFFGYQAGNVNNVISALVNTCIGYQALFSNLHGNLNTATGYQSLFSNTSGDYNTANGYYALRANVDGGQNTANGFYSLYSNTSGNSNVADGFGSLAQNTTGGFNTAGGFASLSANTTGGGNTTYGAQSLINNTIGGGNTAYGFRSLYFHKTGDNETGNGAYSLYNDTSGIENTANGSQSLFNNKNGQSNTANGTKSLYNNIAGNNNTALGYSSFYNGTAFSNSTALGANTVITASNQIRAGDASITSIGGQVGWTTLSDKRFKINVKETVPGLSFILKLRPVTYNLNIDAIAKFTHTPDSLRLKDGENAKAKMLQTGFIAQEVEASAKELGYDFSGVDKPKNENDYYGLRYAEFTVPLIKAVQEQQHIIETQKQNLEIQKHRIDQLEILVKELSLKIK